MYDHHEPDLEPGWLFVLCRRFSEGDVPTSAKLLLWPFDLVRPVREAIAAGRNIDMRSFRKEERQRKEHAKAMRKVIVEPGDDADSLAAELGIL